MLPKIWIFVLSVAGLITLGIIFGPQQESDATVKVPAQVSEKGNEIIISGSIEKTLYVPVTILVSNDRGELITIAQVTPAEDGSFSYSITKQGSLWENTDKYSVKVQYQPPSKKPKDAQTQTKTDTDLQGSTYLSMTVEEWKAMSKKQVMELYEKNKFDFGELGKFLIKDAMEKELQRQNIQNSYKDFEVFEGNQLDSLPPYVDYHAVVNATDGNSYLLEGTTNSNEIRRVVISELVFEPQSKTPSPAVQLFAMKPEVFIVSQQGNNAKMMPHNLILDLNHNNVVTFYNNRTVPVQLEGQNDFGEQMTTKEKNWKSSIIAPNSYGTIQFNKTGYYEYLARTIEERPDVEGGAIVAYSNKTNDLPFQEKLRMAGEFLHYSDLPLTSIGMGNNEGLKLGFTPAIFNSISNAEEYYKKRAQQWIPFDVPIIIEGPIQPFETG